jgi:SAM-dependent methyltransferase
VLLPFVTTSVTLGATASITQDLSPVPLLWALPLALHLGTFAWAFRGDARAPEALCPLAVLVASAVFLTSAAGASSGPAVLALTLLAVGLLGVCLHGRLAQERPPVGALTGYTLAVAAGGALAGALHALVAPAVFTGVTEHPLALALAVALLPSSQPPGDTQTRTRDVLVPLAVALLATGLRGVAPPEKSGALLVVGVPWALLLLASSGRRRRLALGFVALLCVRGADPAVRFEARTFYGTVRVDEARGLRRMFHGSTLHGVSRTDQPPHPMAYYHPDTPIGALLAGLAREAPSARVAVVGLGAGMLCAWAVPGQRWTFFELDAMVARVARRWFPYLSAARAPVEVVLGDARLALGERPGAFDLVVLDAFSSDAIPAHLLTREGLSVALRALRPGGRLAAHVTNRYLRLEGVLAATGRALGLRAWVRRGVVRDLSGGPVTTWVLLRRVDDLDGRPQDPGWAPLDPRGAPWTDDHHALGSVLRWR